MIPPENRSLESDGTYRLDAPEGTLPFDAGTIESELRAMWKRAVEGPAVGSIYRAALSNLVVIPDPHYASKLSPVLAEVTRLHPSRLLSIEPGTEASGSGLRARLGAICHLRDGGGGLVCSEQVVLCSDPDSSPLIPSAVRSLLIGDLPMVLVDLRPSPQPGWADELIEAADLLLADSRARARPKDAAAVWDLFGRKGPGCVHDLAWIRLVPWREAIAEIFDPTETRPSLRSLREVTIEVTGDGVPPSSAWLLLGWLASRLGWTPGGGNPDTPIFRSESGEVRATVRRNHSSPEGLIERVHLVAGEPHPLDIEITHHGWDATATLIGRKPRPGRTEVMFGYRAFATSIVGEIHRHGPNFALEAAAKIAQELMRPWNGV